MNRLGRAAAKRFNLEMEVSQSVETLELWLEAGGCAVIHAGREHGLFPTAAIIFCRRAQYGSGLGRRRGRNENMAPWILRLQNRNTRGRLAGEGGTEDSHILAGAELVKEECAKRSPSFYLFKQRGRKHVRTIGKRRAVSSDYGRPGEKLPSDGSLRRNAP